MDPQQRLLLEVALGGARGRRACRRSGWRAARPACSSACSTNDYARLLAARPADAIDAYTGTGQRPHASLPGRLSYVLGLQGPSLAVDTACSSSLVAVHLACQSLRAGECDAGARRRRQPDPRADDHASRLAVRAMSRRRALQDLRRARPTASCAARACGVVVLKRLRDALADGDRDLRGDPRHGGQPGRAQQRPDRAERPGAGGRAAPGAARAPASRPATSATSRPTAPGTPLGDPIEVRGARRGARRGTRPRTSRCVVGSVKTNIGHLEAAAGVAGLIKAVLCLQHGQIPPQPALRRRRTRTSPWAELPADGARRARSPWPDGDARRRAGVSSFGFSGTNAHVVLEEAPAATPDGSRAPRERRRARAAALGAAAPEALRDAGGALRATCWTRVDGTPALGDVGVHGGAAAHPSRAPAGAWSRGTRDELRRARSRRSSPASRARAWRPARRAPGAGRGWSFVFPGQGSQWLGMGRELLARRAGLPRRPSSACDRRDRRDDRLVGPGASSRRRRDGVAPAARSMSSSPACSPSQVALAALWRRWGIEPDAVVGHSMGEVAAAHVAGALSPGGRGAGHLPAQPPAAARCSGQGAMALVELPWPRPSAALARHARPVCGRGRATARASTVLSGEPAALEEVLGRARSGSEVFCRRVKVDVASHSPQMDPLRDELLRAPWRGRAPRRLGADVLDRDRRGRGRRRSRRRRTGRATCAQPVLFGAAVDAAGCATGIDAFVEISPHPMLLPAVEQNAPAQRVRARAGRSPSLRREEGERAALLESLGALYARGHPVAWERVLAPGRPRALPTYPWQRERYWLRGAFNEVGGEARPRPRGSHPLLGAGLRPAFPPGLRIWETRLSPSSPSWLADHGVRGAVLLPGAAWIEMGLAAAAEEAGGMTRLAEVRFEAALLLPPGEERTVQVVLAEEGEGTALRFFAREESGTWTLHATAALVREDGATPPARDLEILRARYGEELSGEQHYRAARAHGVEYGPAFQGVERVWRGEGEALARLRPAAGRGFHAHPALLDAAFQILLTILPADRESGDTWLPVGIGEVALHRPIPAGETCWSHGRLRTAEGGDAEGDLEVLDESGEVLLEVRGLRLRAWPGTRGARSRAGSTRRDGKRRRRSRGSPAPPGEVRGLWLILADDGGLAREVAALLAESGERCRLVSPDNDGIDPADPEGFALLLAELREAGEAPPAWRRPSLEPAVRDGSGSLLPFRAPSRPCPPGGGRGAHASVAGHGPGTAGGRRSGLAGGCASLGLRPRAGSGAPRAALHAGGRERPRGPGCRAGGRDPVGDRRRAGATRRSPPRAASGP